MNWFAKPTAVIEAPESDGDRLALVEAEYQAAKAEHSKAALAVRTYQAVNRTPPPMFFRNGKCFVPVNREQRCDPVLNCLQNEAERARQRFAAALRVRADFLMRTGAIK
ncbi:MAG TPA: hypothetical protein VOA88_20965 [Candidatus Dormibacteraeota bacterium]|nr:hypothetical protein [Candidatus Dormibacteraeota bacterium]